MKIKPFYTAAFLFFCSSSAFALTAGEACSSKGSTAHTGSSAGGVTLMCNGSTWVEVVSYSTEGKASFKKPVEGTAPVSNKDITTKEYVDNAVASASGGGGGSASSVIVLTRKTYARGYGGLSGGNTKCAEEYPGYKMCTREKIQTLALTGAMPSPLSFILLSSMAPTEWSTGYVDKVIETGSNGYITINAFMYDKNNTNCESGEYYAQTLKPQRLGKDFTTHSWGIGSTRCQYSKMPLACCK